MARELRIRMDREWLRKQGTDSLRLELALPAVAVLMTSLTECLARRRQGDEEISVTLDGVTLEQYHQEWRPLEVAGASKDCTTADCDGDE